MMRDTGDMMEDAFSEDTMMECSGDDADLDDLVDLADEVSNSTPTIRDAAERLLTLLGVENNEDGDDFSSSEDEGVELDGDSEDENDFGDDLVDDDDGTRNTRLLHQLANSLAQELKYSQKKVNKSRLSGSSSSSLSSSSRATRTIRENDDHCMEIAQDVVYLDDARASLSSRKSGPREFPSATSREIHHSTTTTDKCLAETTRIRTSGDLGTHLGKNGFSVNTGLADSWSHGWDACAAEAIRYLVEDEGLSPHHPTVLAMKSHLETQRERTLARYAS